MAGTVSLHPWSLVFSSPQLENGFRKHQSTVWAANELRNVYLNLCCGIVNLTITVCLLVQGSIFTAQGAQLMLPYMTVASVHWYLAANWRQWPRWRSLANLAIEACYSAICTLSMPSWVLHGSITDAKGFLRMFILGSGILIGCWCRFLTPTFFVTARWLIPLQFLFQAWHLTGPTCAAVEAYPYGAAAARELSGMLDTLAATTLPSCPGVHSCHHIGYLLEFVAGLLLLYMHYRLEAANRLAYLQGRAQVARYWPHMPGYVQATLHLLLSLQASSAVWAVLQCSAAPPTVS